MKSVLHWEATRREMRRGRASELALQVMYNEFLRDKQRTQEIPAPNFQNLKPQLPPARVKPCANAT